MQNVVTMEEAGKATNNTKNEKSPRSDGFSVNFFNFFLGKIWVFILLD